MHACQVLCYAVSAMAGEAQARKRNPRGEGERLRTALMDAASELLLERGVEALSIRAVTARAGVSPTALYLHFADMGELLGAVCDAAFEDLRSFLLQAEAAHRGDPRAQMQAMGHAYVRFALERPGHYRILFGTALAPSAAATPHGGAAGGDDAPGKQAFQDLVRATTRCLAPGVDPRPVALQIWTGLHGFVSLRAAMPNYEQWPDADTFLTQLYAAHVGR